MAAGPPPRPPRHHPPLADVELPPTLEIWGYEAHIPLTPHVRSRSEVVDRKRAALAAHRTAALGMDVHATLALNRWRSLITGAGRGHAEAFHVALPDRFLEFVERLRT